MTKNSQVQDVPSFTTLFSQLETIEVANMSQIQTRSLSYDTVALEETQKLLEDAKQVLINFKPHLSTSPLSMGTSTTCDVSVSLAEPSNNEELQIQRATLDLRAQVKKANALLIEVKLRSYSLGKAMISYKNNYSHTDGFTHRMSKLTGYSDTWVRTTLTTCLLYDALPLLLLSSLSQTTIVHHSARIQSLVDSTGIDIDFWSGLEKDWLTIKNNLQTTIAKGTFFEYQYHDVEYEREIGIVLPYGRSQKGSKEVFELLLPNRKDGAMRVINQDHIMVSPLDGMLSALKIDAFSHEEEKRALAILRELEACGELHAEDRSRGYINAAHYGYTRYYDATRSWFGFKNQRIFDLVMQLAFVWERLDAIQNTICPGQQKVTETIPSSKRLFGNHTMLAISNSIPGVHRDKNSLFCGHCAGVTFGYREPDTARLVLHNTRTIYNNKPRAAFFFTDTIILHSVETVEIKEGIERYSLVFYTPTTSCYDAVQ